MKCPKCGRLLSRYATTCPRCKWKRPSKPRSSPPNRVLPPRSTKRTRDERSDDSDDESRRKKRKTLRQSVRPARKRKRSPSPTSRKKRKLDKLQVTVVDTGEIRWSGGSGGSSGSKGDSPPKDPPPRLSQQSSEIVFLEGVPFPLRPCLLPVRRDDPVENTKVEEEEKYDRVPLRVMEWNIERLGGEFLFGVPPIREQAVIEAIARVIHHADPHLCAIIEVMSYNGISELDRIIECLNRLGPAQWDYRLAEPDQETGAGVGKPGTGENYAVLFQRDIGIRYLKSRFAHVVGKSGLSRFPSSRYGHGTERTYRVPAEFFFEMSGQFADKSGKAWTLPLILFHAPGPTAAEERQRIINAMISTVGLIEAVHDWKTYPDCLICADLNADEDARTVLPEAISYPDLEIGAFGLDVDDHPTGASGAYLEALVDIWDEWQEYKDEHRESSGREKRAQLLKLRNDRADELVDLYRRRGEVALLEAIRAYEGEDDDDEIDDDEEDDKAARKKELARNKVWRPIDKILAQAIELGPSSPDESIEELAKLGDWFGERSYEAIHTLMSLALRKKGAPEERRRAIRREFNLLFREQAGILKVDGRQQAFHPVTALGFGLDVTYDDSLVTTRRRSITGLRSSGANGVFRRPRTVVDLNLSNYDQVLPRAEGHLRAPEVITLPILQSVLSMERYKALFSEARDTAPLLSAPFPVITGELVGLAHKLVPLDKTLEEIRKAVAEMRDRIEKATASRKRATTAVDIDEDGKGTGEDEDGKGNGEDEDLDEDLGLDELPGGTRDDGKPGEIDDVDQIPEDRRKALIVQLMKTAMHFLKKRWIEEPAPERLPLFLRSLVRAVPVLRAITAEAVAGWLEGALQSKEVATSLERGKGTLDTDALGQAVAALAFPEDKGPVAEKMRAKLVQLAVEKLEKSAKGKRPKKKTLAEKLATRARSAARTIVRQMIEAGCQSAAEVAWAASAQDDIDEDLVLDTLIEGTMAVALEGLASTPGPMFAIRRRKLIEALVGLPGFLRILGAPEEIPQAIDALLRTLRKKPTKKDPALVPVADIESVLGRLIDLVKANKDRSTKPFGLTVIEAAVEQAGRAIAELPPPVGGETDVLGLRLALLYATLRPDGGEGDFGKLLAKVLAEVLAAQKSRHLTAAEVAIVAEPMVLWLARKVDQVGKMKTGVRVVRAAVEVVERCLTRWGLGPDQAFDFIELQTCLLQAKLISDHNPLLLAAWVYKNPADAPLYDEETYQEEMQKRESACSEMRQEAPSSVTETGVSPVGKSDRRQPSQKDPTPPPKKQDPSPPKDPGGQQPPRPKGAPENHVELVQDLRALKAGDRIRFEYRVSPNIECEAVVLSASEVPRFVLEQDSPPMPQDMSQPILVRKLLNHDWRVEHVYVRATTMFLGSSDNVYMSDKESRDDVPSVVGDIFAIGPGKYQRL